MFGGAAYPHPGFGTWRICGDAVTGVMVVVVGVMLDSQPEVVPVMVGNKSDLCKDALFQLTLKMTLPCSHRYCLYPKDLF